MQHLPLRLFPRHKLLDDIDAELQPLQPRIQLLVHPVLIIAQLGVKVLAVGSGAHSSTEDGLDEEAVVGAQGVAVSVAEGGGEFFAGGVEVLA